MSKKAIVELIPVAAAAGVALDPSQNYGQTLSNGNLTATSTGLTSYQNISRSTTSHGASGKYYVELTHNVVAGSSYNSIMLIDSSFAIGTDSFYTSPHGLAYDMGGNIWTNGTPFANSGAWGSAGNVASIAVDLGASLFWARSGAGVWNALGGNDPATGTGGISFTMGSTLFIAEATHNSSAQVTMNFGATSYANTPPSGFGNW